MTKELQDLAWSVLPKEFKEEVKEDYNYAILNREYAKQQILENLFGEHNLTSDAEGEDEVLTVSRKKVQEEYAVISKELSHRDTDAEDYIAWNYVKMTFGELFGSNCLPDNVDSSESNVDSSRGNVDSLEPKPAEPKFKVGDRVRVKGYGYEPNLHKGDIGEILDINDEEQCFVLFKKSQAWIYADCLEPYTEPKEESPQMKSIESKVSVYLATKEEDEEFRLLLHENGFKWDGDSLLIDSSCWDPDIQDSKIHFVYPDMTVTHGGNKTLDTLTFSEFKKRYFGENVNHRQFIAKCDKQFDNILKDSFSKERRLNIATNVLEALIKSQYYSLSPNYQEENISEMAEVSVRLADALIAEVQSSTESLCSAKKGGRS